MAYDQQLADALKEIERLRAALLMGLQLGESGMHGDGPSCPTCHFVREARKALSVEQKLNEG